MICRSILAAIALSACALLVAHAQNLDRQKVEDYIKQSEAHWAEAAMKRDTATIERILADDFLGVAPDGTFYDKAKEIADVRAQTEAVVSNQLDEVKVRFYGDTAVAQGKETWERRTGNPRHGHYVWTDTWVRKGDKWQIVAAEDVIVPAER